jgi:hypothetical protein
LSRDNALLRQRRYISSRTQRRLTSDSIEDRSNIHCHNATHQSFRLAEKCELTMTSVIMSYLTIAGMIVLTTFPVLVPAIITGAHAILRRTRAATASRRLAVPAAA